MHWLDLINRDVFGAIRNQATDFICADYDKILPLAQLAQTASSLHKFIPLHFCPKGKDRVGIGKELHVCPPADLHQLVLQSTFSYQQPNLAGSQKTRDVLLEKARM
jgi:hypothetical protein